MNVLTTTVRLSIGLASITLSAVLTAGLLGLIPDRDSAVLEGRAKLCEAVAVGFTLLAQEDDYQRLRLGLEAIVDRDPELVTAGVRHPDGSLVARVGDHDRLWNDPDRKELPGADCRRSDVVIAVRQGGGMQPGVLDRVCPVVHREEGPTVIPATERAACTLVELSSFRHAMRPIALSH